MRTNFSFKGLSSANNARHLFIALLFSCFFMLLSYVQYGQYCDTDHSQPPQAMGGGGGSVPTPCNSHLNYIPDDYAPTLIVRLNFQYFYYSQSNPQNFMPTWDGVDAANPMNAYIFSNRLIDQMNLIAATNAQMVLPPGNTTEVMPYKVQFHNSGVHCRESPTYYDACNSHRAILEELFTINGDSEINCFFTNPSETASSGSGCGGGGVAEGIGGENLNTLLVKQIWSNNYLTGYIGLGSTYEENVNWIVYTTAVLLLHEIMHNLGLPHTTCNAGNWNTDECADTPTISEIQTALPNCDSPSGSTCCSVGGLFNPCCSNNLMDYKQGTALTPCQLGRVHRDLILFKRSFLYEDYCTHDPTKNVTIPSGLNLVWQGARIFKGDVTIEPGSTVTIKCTVYMPEGSRFIVKPGAKLIIDGGKITHGCDALWSGIEVWGNRHLNQGDIGNQGIVEVKNSGTIEYATTGIRTTQGLANGAWNIDRTGGIIRCTNAVFLNNLKSVEFLTYQNTINNSVIDNVSYFYKSTFTINDATRFPDETHNCFIYMWQVHGVKIKGCLFQTTLATNAASSINRGYGIYSAQSSYKVSDYCQLVPPLYLQCNPNTIVRNQFTNLHNGIRAAGLMKTRLISVDHAIFDNNYCGIMLSGFGQSQIINNDFSWNASPEGGQGVYLIETTGFEVEENNFNGNSCPNSVGVVVDNTGKYSNRIYRNNFVNCRVGSQAAGTNRLNGVLGDVAGMEWSCNTYLTPTLSNCYAIASEYGATVSSYQGYYTNHTAAGNLFSPECTPPVSGISERDLKVLSNSPQSFYTYIHSNGAVPTPSCHTPGIQLISNNANETHGVNACKKDISTDKGPISSIGSVFTNHGNVQTMATAYDEYINNGIGPQLRNLIKDPYAASIDVRNALMDAAPRVSDNLLIMAIQRDPAMDGWHLAQALLANSPLKSDVRRVLEESDYNQYYKDLVETNQVGGVAPRVWMGMDLTYHTMERDLAKEDLLRLYTGYDGGEPMWDSILQMPNQFPFCISTCDKAAILMENGNYHDAGHHLNTHCEVDSARFAMLQIALDLLQNPDSTAALSTDQQAALQAIADDVTHAMSHTACVILEFWGGPRCERTPAMLEELEPRSQKRPKKATEFGDIKALMAFPNPASESIRVSTMLPPDCQTLVLNVYDIQGKIVATENMLSHHGMLELDCAKWSSGNYLMELIGDKIKLGTTQVVVVHNN